MSSQNDAKKSYLAYEKDHDFQRKTDGTTSKRDLNKGQAFFPGSCKSQMELNKTHNWIKGTIRGMDCWVCSRCGINGWEIDQGPAIAFETCQKRMMKKALI